MRLIIIAQQRPPQKVATLKFDAKSVVPFIHIMANYSRKTNLFPLIFAAKLLNILIYGRVRLNSGWMNCAALTPVHVQQKQRELKGAAPENASMCPLTTEFTDTKIYYNSIAHTILKMGLQR